MAIADLSVRLYSKHARHHPWVLLQHAGSAAHLERLDRLSGDCRADDLAETASPQTKRLIQKFVGVGKDGLGNFHALLEFRRFIDSSHGNENDVEIAIGPKTGDLFATKDTSEMAQEYEHQWFVFVKLAEVASFTGFSRNDG